MFIITLKLICGFNTWYLFAHQTQYIWRTWVFSNRWSLKSFCTNFTIKILFILLHIILLFGFIFIIKLYLNKQNFINYHIKYFYDSFFIGLLSIIAPIPLAKFSGLSENILKDFSKFSFTSIIDAKFPIR